MEFSWTTKLLVWTAIKAAQFPRLWRYGKRLGYEIRAERRGDAFAILALGPGADPAVDGVLTLLDVLKARRVNSIVVINGVLPRAILDALGRRSHCLIFRRNFGRDFAAYREASLYLYEQGIRPAKVLYANDSVVYFNTPELAEDIGRLLAADADLVGATDSFEETYHIGGYLFALSGKAFLHREIERFWRNYRVYDLRPHAIHAGEHRLTTTVVKCGFRTDTLYKAHRVVRRLEAMSVSEILNVSYIAGARAAAIAGISGREYRSRFSEVFGGIVKQRLVTRLASDLTANPIHAAFGYYRHFFRLPLVKKDLLARMHFSEEQVVRLLHDLPEADRTNALSLLNRRGRNANREFLSLLKLKLELA